jgi:two-component system, cell cycle sensor histidine kinase and response regulator CckA
MECAAMKKRDNLSDQLQRLKAEQKITAEGLQQAQRELTTLFQAIGHPTVILDADHRIVRANKAACRMLGKSEEALAGACCFTLFHTGADRPPVNCPLRKMVASGTLETVETEVEALDGNFIVTCTPLLDEKGSLKNVVHVATDITDRKRAEGNLEREWSFLRQMVDAVPAFISVVDADGRFELANKSLAQVWGAAADSLIGKTMAEVNPNEDEVLRFQADNRAVLEERKEKFIPAEKVTYSDRSVKWLTVYKVPLSNREGVYNRVLSVGTDMTYLKESEEEMQKLQGQLIQIQKMEAIGTLAGGIAHDFNNILMGVQGYISLLLYDLHTDHPHRVKLENMEHYIKRGADLTKQLLGFARGGKYDVKPTNMNELLRNSTELFGRTRKDIGVARRFEEELWTVNVDQGQMDQVFLNLFINAAQAMPGGGNLDIKTDNVTLSKGNEKLVGVTEGQYVMISVTDDGIGMDSKTLERIFEPFFSTKAKGTGTGLGLASAYGIIKNHGGCIHVASQPGKGTTFTIYLPATERKPEVQEETEKEIFTGWETIMVVDDEQVNIAVIKEMLEMLHYRVLPVGSGQEAVAVYLEKGKEIDLVILDMVMPGISGGRTFDILKEINPNVAVILATGYSAEGEARAIINRGCRGFIQKPFQLQDLSRKIREVLENRARLDSVSGSVRRRPGMLWASPNKIPC